jgi:hypothetical protein
MEERKRCFSFILSRIGVSGTCFPIKTNLYGEVIKVEYLEKLDSLVQRDVLTVRSTARNAYHLQFDISANALEARAVKSPLCIV